MPGSPPALTTELIGAAVPFAGHLGITFSVLRPDRVVATLPSRDHYATIGGSVHGGAQMALADVTAAVLAVLASGDPAAAPSTLHSSTDFLRPARGPLTATGTVRKAGTSTVVDVEITDEEGTATAVVRQTVLTRLKR